MRSDTCTSRAHLKLSHSISHNFVISYAKSNDSISNAHVMYTCRYACSPIIIREEIAVEVIVSCLRVRHNPVLYSKKPMRRK